jgi:hypothetical protein
VRRRSDPRSRCAGFQAGSSRSRGASRKPARASSKPLTLQDILDAVTEAKAVTCTCEFVLLIDPNTCRPTGFAGWYNRGGCPSHPEGLALVPQET